MGIAADMEARPRYESKARWQYHSRKSKKDLWEEIRIHNALRAGHYGQIDGARLVWTAYAEC